VAEVTGSEAGEFGGTSRFAVQGRLGAGGYGVVYRALDRERNVPVALKTLRNVAAKALVRFKQEFRALADVSHPNLVTLYELSSHDQQWFFTMELVDGVNFLWYVRGETYPAETGPTSAVTSPTTSGLQAFLEGGRDGSESGTIASGGVRSTGVLSVERLRHALPQLVDGVLALHDAGKLHRDIKPSNVLVTREGRVVLLDFGLVAEIAPAQTHTVEAAGTPAYMSPEQVAGLPLTQASDWYNVGSMLYQALTGRLPFTGTVIEVIQCKRESEPVPPREIAPGVPDDLDDLCRRLLRRDSAQRPSGAEVRRALKGGDLARPGPAPVPVAGVAVPFVGREQHLEALRGAYQALKDGRALTVAVHGGSGMGKTALVRRFLEELKTHDPQAVVLAGRCYERESVPYKALDALIDALSRYLRRLPSAQAEAFLPHDIMALARLFPVLRQVGAVTRARRAVLEIPDSLELRRRAFAALRELLVRLADRRPLVLFIDDLQWGDVDSAALLEDLLRPPDPPTLLLVGCYRSEEAETSPLLKVILPKRLAVGSALEMRDIVVGELSAQEARDLAVALATGQPSDGKVPAEAIARESGGNPYFIEELVRFSQAESESSSPRLVTFDEALATRVSRLTEGSRRLLEVVAVSGVPIEAGVAYRAADLEREGESVLAVLRSAHLVRARTALARNEIETYHDRIRDAVVALLSTDALRECHHRLASALLASGRADPEMLAMHHLGAGDVESAAEYAAAAAAKASEALAFDRAAGLYRFALNLRTGTASERAKLEICLADALANAGRGAEAAQVYLLAAKEASPAVAIDLHRRAAQQFFISGHFADGSKALNTVLGKLGMELPASPRKALLFLLLRRAQIRLRGLRFRERDETQIPAQDLLRIDTCWAVGVGIAMVDMVRGADFQARHLVLALRAGEPYRVARALAMEGAYVAMGGSRSRARAQKLIDRSHRLAERVDHPYALGLATVTAGNAAWMDGRWSDARVLCEKGEQILRERCTGVDWEVLIAQLFGLASMFFLGEMGALSRRLPLLLEEAEGRGSLLRATFLRIGFCSHMAWLAADDPGTARQELEAGLAGSARDRLDYRHLWVRGARTDIALYRGEVPDASEPLDPGSRAFARTLERFVQAGFIRGLDTRARRRLAAAAEAVSPGERDGLLRGAEQHARAILGERTRWGDPLAALLRAGAAATRGETEAALRFLESAEAGFTAAAMALHAAATRRRRGELMGGDAGRDLVSGADAWMAAQSIKAPERMAAVLAPGRWPSS
jgi:eukaryotic-like serine/threonine-protein kinase